MELEPTPATAPVRDRGVAALLALVAGPFGIHHFYLGRTTAGVLSLLFFWTGIPALVSVVNLLQLLFMHPARFRAKYNPSSAPASERAANEVFETEFSADEAARFADLAQALAQLNARGGLAFLTTQHQQLPLQLLSNNVATDGGGALPTLTLQSASQSLLFTPRQVVFKRNRQVCIRRYHQVHFELIPAGTYKAVENPQTLDTVVEEAGQLIDSLFGPTKGGAKFQFKVKQVLGKLEWVEKGEALAPVHDLVLQQHTQLSLRTEGIELQLTHPDSALMAVLERALRAF